MTTPPPATPRPTTPRSTTPQRTKRGAPVERFWHKHLGADGTWNAPWHGGPSDGPPGEDLADLRAGLGRPAGSVPALWKHYTSRVDGAVTPELEAEHGALSLYGLHQQGQPTPMHRRGVSAARALRELRGTDEFTSAAMDRRVAAAVNATSVPAFLHRLRGLVPLLRGRSIAFDYDLLCGDLMDWAHPAKRPRVRRSWGAGYYPWERAAPADPADPPS
ncbi:type I-E CRISPR-associated protein Cse2/CasB [Streptomyces sp. NPDC048057]|uniref:type I-E CRISPR-associated protein Cse2/CasB n=1 Tax=Streptomyces sp. NPDC048057 TaxID=3155628 RepID=UPI00340C985D